MKHLTNRLLRNNSGEIGLDHLILIAIAFVAGAILVAAVIAIVADGYPRGISDRISDWLR